MQTLSRPPPLWGRFPHLRSFLRRASTVPVDPCFSAATPHQVYKNHTGVWDAILNHTDIVGVNSNKFYALQLLHPVGSDSDCILFTRWGRVGENGTSQIKGPFPAAIAMKKFKSQFVHKSGVKWEKRLDQPPKEGRYVWLERNYDENESQKDQKTSQMESIPESTLAPPIQEVLRLIFSQDVIDSTLSSLNYDAQKLPLGKLSKTTILNGFSALKKISEVLTDPTGKTARENGNTLHDALAHLTGKYYSIVPHNFGRNKPLVIDTVQRLKLELDLVDALGDIEIASKFNSSSTSEKEGNTVNPIDTQYQFLGLSRMEVVSEDSQEFKAIAGYARDSHGKRHTHIRKDGIKHIYRVERPGESERWMKGGFDKVADGERLLLWHGSRTANFVGILQQGLRIAPPEAPSTGYMFGKGVYFADVMSKSAGYCHSNMSRSTGLLLLCEVATLPVLECLNGDFRADEKCLKLGKRATKGVGRNQPVKWKDAGDALGNPELLGCYMPDGIGMDAGVRGYLQYNEYIVYDVSQIRVRYMVMMNM